MDALRGCLMSFCSGLGLGQCVMLLTPLREAACSIIDAFSRNYKSLFYEFTTSAWVVAVHHGDISDWYLVRDFGRDMHLHIQGALINNARTGPGQPSSKTGPTSRCCDMQDNDQQRDIELSRRRAGVVACMSVCVTWMKMILPPHGAAASARFALGLGLRESWQRRHQEHGEQHQRPLHFHVTSNHCTRVRATTIQFAIGHHLSHRVKNKQ